MTDLLFVFGTRPEAIKIGPVVAALRKMNVNTRILTTGQHTDLLRGTPAESDLVDAENCGLASDGNVVRWLTRAQDVLKAQYDRLTPRMVVVQGDTMSALAAASAAHMDGIPVAHIEAGIRSHNPDNPWPEETTRVSIAEMAEWHYAPTDTALKNLVTEGVTIDRIRVTGNPIVSAIARYTDAKFVKEPLKQIMVTLHRREIQTPEKVQELTEAIYAAAAACGEHLFVWPQHPAFAKLAVQKVKPLNVYLPGPLPYKTFVESLAASKGLITDSGGAVEEAATLGVPTIVLRAVTDRPEAEAAGIAVRGDPTAENVMSGTLKLMLGDIERKPHAIYGGVDAAERIAAHLASIC